jgi:CHAT domain-containing protein/Tfp pilus assembly protein PilF
MAVRAALVLSLVLSDSVLSLHAQSPAAPSAPSPANELPAPVQQKLVSLQTKLWIYQAAGDRGGQARTLSNIGNVYFGLGENQKALDFFNQALPIYRAVGDRAGEADTLNNIGIVYDDLGEKQKALDYFNQALPISRAVGDRAGQAGALNNIGRVYSDLGEKQKALDYYIQALPIYRAVGNRGGQARTLNNIGLVYSGLGENQKALDYYNQALPILRAVGDRAGQAGALNNIGRVYSDLGENQKALDFYNQALTIYRAVGDRNLEAYTLNNIGLVYSDLGEKQKALDFYNQALPILRAVGDRGGQAATLSNIGLVYSDLGEKQKALDFYNQALPIFRAVGDRGGEANMLSIIGHVHSDLGEPQKALDFYNQALPILQAVGDRRGQANTLNNIGIVYDALGEKQKALDFCNQALTLYRAVGDRGGEAATLSNIGSVYSDLGEKQKALDYYNQALPISRAVGDRAGQAGALNNIGSVYSDLGEKQKALDFYNQALPLATAVGDRGGEAATLDNIGLVYSDLGEKQKALDDYNQALPIATAVSDPLQEAVIFYNLANNQRATQPALAIFYGKQAVNFLQQVRGNIQGIDKKLQASFLASKADYYHTLADLLIAQGRLPEAEQVLDLLKEQEYSDYVRGGDLTNTLTLTPAEEQAEADYQKSTTQLVSLGAQWAELNKIATRTPQQEQQYQQLNAQLDAASKGLTAYYHRLYDLFGKNSDANRQRAAVKGNVSALEDLVADMPGTVALYTMVTSDHYGVIVITATGTVAREYAIPESELNKKVADFQRVLSDGAHDPKPAAQELYKILIGPVKADLDQARAETLVWSLDGVLRYVPMAALFDGNKYLIENYNTVTIAPESIPHLADQPDLTGMSAVGMGISKQYRKELIALPAVVGELDHVVKDSHVQGANGVLPGKILLDDQFTEKAMENLLDGRHAVVHIASHFVFRPGDDSHSYLLLAGKDEGGAGGLSLTVADFSSDPRLTLRHTDLLTLSACDTGMSGNAADGSEVDGLSTTAQLKGAKAVISSLWDVDDDSTGDLMADFYKRWVEGNGKVTKAKALRLAQLDLLHGEVKPKPDPTDPTRTSFAQPYYWAPFVLMGNWK